MTQRQEIIERLNGLELEGGSHEMLSAICKAVLPHSDAWTLRRCWDLRDRLVRLLGGDEVQDRSITDELRHYIEGSEQLYGYEYKRSRAIADRIDAAHEEALREAYTKGREDGMGMANAKDAQAEYLRGKNDGYDDGYDAGYASADDWLAQHEDAMAEHGWYRVVDADKAPIRFNDDMEWELLGSGETESGRVVGIKIDLIADRQNCRVKVVRDSDFQTIGLMAEKLHHVKPVEPEPTVEDVLREFGDWYVHTKGGCDEDGIIAEYAAKLRLADDRKEQ